LFRSHHLTVGAPGRGDRELFVQRDGSSLGRPLQQRHEGYLHSNLLAATLRANREVDVFVLLMAPKNSFLRPLTHALQPDRRS
jgi:hypothetical protein